MPAPTMALERMNRLLKMPRSAACLLRLVRNVLLAWSAVCCMPALAQEQAALLSLINAYRATPQACAGASSQVASPLSPDARLVNVDVSQDPVEALRKAGLHVVAMEAISVSGLSNAEAVMKALESRYCTAITKKEYTTAGISRTADTWRIVLAAPRLASDPGGIAKTGDEILQLVNAARSAPRTCGSKRFRAARPLGWNERLARAALMHSQDMANENYVGHLDKAGASAAARARRAGYHWRAIGENVAAGQSSARSVVEGWLSSPGHCANIMRPDFTEMGAAYAISQESDLLIYWTQVFGAPR